MRRSVAASLALAVAFGGCGEAVPRGAGNFYEGRRLEVIVPFGPGGGTDTWARLIASHLQGWLGEGSSVQVINIAGATSIAGANEFVVRRRPDGLTALVTAGSTYYLYMLGERAVRYDFDQLEPILLSPVGGVILVRSDLGVRDGAGLRGVQSELIYGGISATANDIMALLAFEVLGLDVRTILGYASKGALRVAFEQGETTIEYQTMPAYLTSVAPLVEDGIAIPLMSFGVVGTGGELVRDPSTPELPTVEEVYREMYGRRPEGAAWEAYRAVLGAGTMMQKLLWLHAEAPVEAVSALRRAAEEMARDPVFLEAAHEEIGAYPIYVGEAAAEMVATVRSTTPETLSWLKEWLRSRFGVDTL